MTLARAITTTAEEGEEAEVPEDWELLADFGADVTKTEEGQNPQP